MGIIVNGIDIGNPPATNTLGDTRSNYTLIQVLQSQLDIALKSPYVKVINSFEDFNCEIGVITLEDYITYIFTTSVDLMGCRIVCGLNNVIMGYSSENCSITSTTLGVGVPLITATSTVVIKSITLKDVDTCLDLDGSGNTMALDWVGLNFENIPNIGTIKNFANFIFSDGALLSSNNLIFDGTSDTIAFSGSIFIGSGVGQDIIRVEPTAIISRRFRMIYSSLVAFSGDIGINFSASATVPTESYILDTINFSGGSTYLSGVTVLSNSTLFIRCIGITNTSVTGQVYMTNNPTLTPIAVVGTYYKILGTTTNSPINAKFVGTDNRLTCNALISRRYLVTANISFTSENNRECGFAFYDSSTSAIITSTITKSTSNSAGRAENISLTTIIDIIAFEYIEVHCTNLSNTASITVTDLNFLISEIK